MPESFSGVEQSSKVIPRVGPENWLVVEAGFLVIGTAGYYLKKFRSI